MQGEVGEIQDALDVGGLGAAGVDEVVAAGDPVVDCADAEGAASHLILWTGVGEEEECKEGNRFEKGGRHGE